MTKEDVDERKKMQNMLTKLYYVVIGDEQQGIEGMVHRQKKTLERIECIESKLEKDNELLWWNRTANGVWEIIKKPLLYLITFAILASVIGGSGVKSAVEYLQKNIFR